MHTAPPARSSLPAKWAGIVFLAATLGLLAGCFSPESRAHRLAARMLAPEATARETLRCRQKLIALGAAAYPYLDLAFFPIGLYDVPESALPAVAAAGFNLIVNGDNTPSYLDRAEAGGMRVIPYIRLDNMAADAERFRDEPRVFAWYLYDEPDLNGMPPRTYKRLARKLRKLDPDRPIFLTVLSPARYDEYVAPCDILAPNPYPIIHEESERNELRWVGVAVDAAREAAGRRPVWAVVQAFHGPPIWRRNPTPDELRAMVFLALNHGANGIVYFSYRSGNRPITGHRDLFRTIAETNARIRALRGALLVPPSSNGVQVEDAEDGPPPVDVSLRDLGHARLLIVVNPDPRPKSAELYLDETQTSLKVLAVFDDGDAASFRLPPGEPLRIWFEPFQVHVLMLEPVD